MINIPALYEGIGAWQHNAGLAQYSPTGDYSEITDLPAVVYWPVDHPDATCEIRIGGLKAEGRQRPLQITVRFIWRATGPDPRRVLAMADAVFNVLTAPPLTTTVKPGGGKDFEWSLINWGEVQFYPPQIHHVDRTTPEASTDSKYRGNRWTVADTYEIDMW